MYGYLKKPKLLIIAGSLALPEQIWKKEIIFITHIIPCKIGNAIQPRNGIIRTNIDKIEATSIFSACLTWNIAYFDEFGCEKCNNNAYKAHEIANHGKNLVV